MDTSLPDFFLFLMDMTLRYCSSAVDSFCRPDTSFSCPILVQFVPFFLRTHRTPCRHMASFRLIAL